MTQGDLGKIFRLAGKNVPYFEPSGDVRHLVILLHGYGADGLNLLSLGQMWSPALPHTLFASPHAIHAHPSGWGYQWFDLPQGPFSAWSSGVESASKALVPWIQSLEQLYNLKPDQIALVGFSQGAMLALHTSLYHLQVGSVVAYSGLLIPTSKTIRFKPRILLVHGDQDDVLPVECFWQTRTLLDQASVPYTPLLIPGMPHSIDQTAAEQGKTFLQEGWGLGVAHP